MFRATHRTVVLLAILSCAVSVVVGQNTTIEPVVPSLINFAGTLSDVSGKPLTGVVGVTFNLYRDARGGAPLWVETQNVKTDSLGNYSVALGSTNSQGLPAGLFSSGQARWLGVRAQGQEEQPRVMLLAVPYALKAGDSQTIGGLPPSAFVLAAPASSAASSTTNRQLTRDDPPASNVTGSGTTNYVPLWTSTSNIANSVLFQKGSGGSAKVGINTIAPATTLDVKGGTTIRGLLNLPTTGTATAASGKNSQPMNLASSVFNSGTSTAVTETFQWLAEPVGNNTSGATGSMNLLFGQGTSKPTETGLRFASNGQITFAPGQTFPGTGTIAGVTAGTALTGGGTSGNVTLNLDTTKVPLLNANNTFTGNQSVTGDLNSTGTVNAHAGNINDFMANSTDDSAVQASTTADGQFGVIGYASGPNSMGVFGIANPSSSDIPTAGVFGEQDSEGGYGVLAQNYSNAGQGLWAETGAQNSSNGAGPDGVHGVSHSGAGSGVAGINDAAGGIAVYGRELASNSYAGRFDGNVWVNGNLSKNGGSFKIDHPLDPANKYLYHSFVESPDMKNIYDGVAILDAGGEAMVTMPDWFGALNRDFRYQLTCIGGFAPVYIAEEIANNQFKIGGGHPGMKVSWQVTGTRQDAWANAHRIPVEEVKQGEERGTYLHPELFGAPENSAVGWGRYRFPDGVRQKSPLHRRSFKGLGQHAAQPKVANAQ